MDDQRLVFLTLPGLLADELLTLIDQGALPTFSKLVATGVLGIFTDTSARHPLSDLWTIATGCSEAVHGVRHPYVPMPFQAGLYPVGRDNICATPLWEILARQGISACSIGWAGTRGTTDDQNLLTFSDDVAAPFGTRQTDWPIMPGSISKAELSEEVLPLRVHPVEVLDSDIDYFLSRNSSKDARDRFRVAFAANSTYHAICLFVLQRCAARVVCLNLDLPLRVKQSLIMHKAERRQVLALYNFIDMQVARLVASVAVNTSFLIVSTPLCGHGKKNLAGAFIMSGSDLRSDTLINGARLADIAPSAIHKIGAAIPSSLPGRVLTEAWRNCPLEKKCEINIQNYHLREHWALSQMDLHRLDPPAASASMRATIERFRREFCSEA